MWPFKDKPVSTAQLAEFTPNPLALRTFEIEQKIERGFFRCNGGSVAGSFSVVAAMLAEQEAQIARLSKAP